MQALIGISIALFLFWLAIGDSDMTAEIWQDVKEMGFLKATGYLILACAGVFTFIAVTWALAFLMDCGVQP